MNIMLMEEGERKRGAREKGGEKGEESEGGSLSDVCLWTPGLQ